MNNARRWFVVGIILCLSVSLGLTAFGQSNRGTIKGTVSDPSGALVAGATVTATNVATKVVSRATTDANGNYQIPFLPPATYDLSVEQKGFKKQVQANISVPAGDTVRQDIALTLGDITETLSVSAENVQLKSDTSELGTTIGGNQILDLPLAGNQGEQRNPIAFMTLIPGVTGRGAIYTNERYFSQTINGGQSAANEFAVEGAPILNSNGAEMAASLVSPRMLSRNSSLSATTFRPTWEEPAADL